MTSQTSEVNTEGGRRNMNGQELLKQYLYALLLVKLFSENEQPLGDTRSENAPFQRTDTLPTPDTAEATNDDETTRASPTTAPLSTSPIATTEDHFTNWVRVGACRYQAVTDQQNYHYAKQDCASLGARLAAPEIIKNTMDISSFTTKVGLSGVAYWVGVEEDSHGSDIASDQEPRYSENGRFPSQECLAIVAHPNAVLNSYMSCQRTTPAYVCQVC